MDFMLTLAANDMERSEFFYRHILGFTIERFRSAPDSADILIIRQNNANIVMRPAAALRACHPALFEHLERTPMGAGMSLDFNVDNLRGIERNLKKHMIPVVYELNDAQHQRREAWVYDPNGYLVTLSQDLPL